MNYESWLSLTDQQRYEASQRWSGYEEGYWHSLVETAASNLAVELKEKVWVLNVHHAIHHGGSLVIGVVTSFKPGEKVPDLPYSYAGFPVLPFLHGPGPYP